MQHNIAWTSIKLIHSLDARLLFLKMLLRPASEAWDWQFYNFYETFQVVKKMLRIVYPRAGKGLLIEQSGLCPGYPLPRPYNCQPIGRGSESTIVQVD